jgi:hypothetical protein
VRVGKDGNVGIDCPRPARFTRYFAAPSPGSWQRDEATCGSKPDLSATVCAVGNAGIVGISYRYFEHVCDVCERRCLNRGAVHRRECRNCRDQLPILRACVRRVRAQVLGLGVEGERQMLALTNERAQRRLPTPRAVVSDRLQGPPNRSMSIQRRDWGPDWGHSSRRAEMVSKIN